LKIRDSESEGRILRNVTLTRDDLKFVVEAWECAEDEERMLYPFPSDEEDLEGDYVYKEYDSFSKALEKVVELKEKNWDVIELRILPKSKKLRLLVVHEIAPKDSTKISFAIDLTEVNKSLSEKLAKIKRIVEEVK